MEESTRVLLVPIFRRYFLWHAWGGPVAAAGSPAGTALRHWREGRNLEEKTQLLTQSASAWLQNKLWTEWRKLETAKEGTMRNRGYRMAQAVLSREDPAETFLKNLPARPAPVEVIYPTAYREKLVRRQLRHVAADGRRRHSSRLLLWVLALVPQLPLMATPLPNVTVYYTGYRIYSHYRALQGSRSLEESLGQLNSQQMRVLRDELLTFQERHPGFKFPRDEWPAKLIRREHRYLDVLQRMKQVARERQLMKQRQLDEAAGGGGGDEQQQQQQQEKEEREPLLTFTPSVELSDLVRPADRLASPLSDEAAVAVGHLFGVDNMIELVARARRRATGSMFPSQRSEERPRGGLGRSDGASDGSGGGRPSGVGS